MAAPADYWDTADLKAIARGGVVSEAVMEKIWDISSIPLEFSQRCETDSTHNSFDEWTQETHPDPNLNNFIVSGSDITSYNNTQGKRVGNHCQIIHDAVAVTTRASSTKQFGRSNEFGHQVMKAQQRARRDAEAIYLSPQGSQADNNNDTPGKLGGLDAWLESNVSVAAGGSVGGFNTSTGLVTAPTNGTAKRALTEKLISDEIDKNFANNGNPTVLMSVAKVIKNLGRFFLGADAPTARPTANISGQGGRVDQTAQGYVKIMVTDYGYTLTLIPNRLQQQYATDRATLFGIDFGMVQLAFLRGWSVDALAKLGLSDRSFAFCDVTLRVNDEKAHFAVRDIDVNAAVTSGTT